MAANRALKICACLDQNNVADKSRCSCRFEVKRWKNHDVQIKNRVGQLTLCRFRNFCQHCPKKPLQKIPGEPWTSTSCEHFVPVPTQARMAFRPLPGCPFLVPSRRARKLKSSKKLKRNSRKHLLRLPTPSTLLYPDLVYGAPEAPEPLLTEPRSANSDSQMDCVLSELDMGHFEAWVSEMK